MDQPRQHPHGIGAAGKAEQIDLVARRLYRARAGGADPQNGSDHAGAGQSRRLGADRLQAVLLRRGAEAAGEAEIGSPMPPQRKTRCRHSPFDNAAQFARITSTRWPTIRFVGVWDTVASVIVPRADRFYWPSLEELAFTLQNPSVQMFRQAISIDERRCMFRLKKWDEPQTYKPNRFNDDHAEPQDICRCGSPACMPISAAAIRKRKAGYRNIRCSG